MGAAPFMCAHTSPQTRWENPVIQLLSSWVTADRLLRSCAVGVYCSVRHIPAQCGYRGNKAHPTTLEGNHRDSEPEMLAANSFSA